jgi:hypothetical protein
MARLRYGQDWCTGSLMSGEFPLIRSIVLHRFAVFEGNALQQQLDLFGAVDAAPGFLGFLDQLECQIQEGGSRCAVARTRSTVAYRRKRRLDCIGRSQMLPVLGREIIEREQNFSVLLQRVRRLRILGRMDSSLAT